MGSVGELASRWEEMSRRCERPVEKEDVFEGRGEMEVVRVRSKRRVD